MPSTRQNPRQRAHSAAAAIPLLAMKCMNAMAVGIPEVVVKLRTVSVLKHQDSGAV